MQQLTMKLQYQNHLALRLEPPGREQLTLPQVPCEIDVVEEELDVDVVEVDNLVGLLKEKVQGQDKPQKDHVHIAIRMDSL